MQNKTIYFIYDGACPMCKMVSKIYKIRQNIGQNIYNLQIIDARNNNNHKLMLEIKKARINLDDGMVIKYNKKLYHGADALNLMAHLGSKKGFFNRIYNIIYKSKLISYLCYPFLKLLRNIAIYTKRAGKINNLDV